MSTQKLYNQWSASYDAVENKTRDLEKKAAQRVLSAVEFDNVVELGCGTGKNTEWLAARAKHLLAVDFSEDMMAKAKAKIKLPHVQFKQGDIMHAWDFVSQTPALITCSLVLEHVKDLHNIFRQAGGTLKTKGWFYICELHPYKQYSGSKARFETDAGTLALECFVHHVSEYVEAAVQNNFTCVALNEWFDEDNRANPPRLISFLFRKND